MTAAEALRESAGRQADLVRSGDLSARELVQAALHAVARLNPGIGAFVTVAAERALTQADAVGSGDPRPLCGVPIAIKDLFSATEGIATTHGSAAFGDWVADHDTAHVRRLREAGAIVIGRTKTPELGLRPVTDSSRFGATRNPWAHELNAGGSSGGSAAAVATGMVALADGSDIGGSIRIPASCCGVIGFKPSRGRVSVGPDFGDIAGGTMVYGPITRTVRDAALALDVMVGHEPGDRHLPIQQARTFLDATDRSPGRTTIWLALAAPFGMPVDAEPRAAASRAAAALADLGHDVSELVPDWDDDTFGDAWSLLATGGMQHMVRALERLHGRPLDPQGLEPATRAWLIDHPAVPAADVLEAGERLSAFTRRLLSSWDPETVLLTPTLTRLPAPLTVEAQPGVTPDAARFSALTRLWNVTGQPAVSLPLHVTDDGIPVGVQLVGAPGRDDLLIALAAQLEASVGWAPATPAAGAKATASASADR